MSGWGESFGAVTVVNAIPCGKGATLGIDLRTLAEFEPGGDALSIEVEGGDRTDDRLGRICAKRMHEALGIPCVGRLRIWSEIPVSRGLKSSSSAANAVCLAVNNAHGGRMDELEALKIGCRSSIDAGVSVTGAFDDACGCHFGGLVVTDNARMHIEAMVPSVGEHSVLLHVPEERIEKRALDLPAFRRRRGDFEDLIERSAADPFGTMSENGRLVAEIVGADDGLARRALEKGAAAAGMSGTGPAVAVIADEDLCKELILEQGKGRFILSRLRGVSE